MIYNKKGIQEKAFGQTSFSHTSDIEAVIVFVNLDKNQSKM